MITHDIEIVKGKNKYLISDNPFTYNDLTVVSYDVQGADYKRTFQTLERVNGRFLSGVSEDKKKVSLRLRYSTDRPAFAAQLKTRLQALLAGDFYIRELATNDPTIEFEQIGTSKMQEFELDYVDGNQLHVGLVSGVNFDTTQIAGEFTLDFETIDLPYFESIGYSTDLASSPNLNLWGAGQSIVMTETDWRRRYVFNNVRSDKVYYWGDVPLNQFNQNAIVEIVLGKDVSADSKDGFTFYLEHSDIMKIKGLNLKAGDVIKFDGLHVYRNGLTIDEYNEFLEQPVLMPGENIFNLNQNVQKITFKHKMYFR
ncbi:phage tail domain-containing protein [uncultured Staphylococcus sp.]|uniref:phage tail domain-containing protein n=1 Tax=uncultured Staphylococcus sp. TaxID=189668 RepID=UPI0025EBA5CD|nr:phage tail domain-containing protein [uncultured Staphylococcus sp.]